MKQITNKTKQITKANFFCRFGLSSPVSYTPLDYDELVVGLADRMAIQLLFDTPS